jgi:hypothetical protein
MKREEIVFNELNAGKFPEVEITIGYFEDKGFVNLRNHKLIGLIYEFDKNTGYCRFKNDSINNLIIHINSIKLI